MLGDIGDLRPNHHAVLVAQVVEILVVLVVGQPDGVGPHLPDHGHVGVVVLFCDGVADALPVLVAGHAVEGIGPPVEEEAFFRVHREGAHTEPGADLVHRSAVHQQRGLAGVQIGVLHPVP